MKKAWITRFAVLCALTTPLWAGNDKQVCSYPKTTRLGQITQSEPASQALTVHKTVTGLHLSERTTLRRLWLDLTGVLPPRAVVEEYLASDDPAKWATMVEGLLDSEAYVARWTTFFNDLFLNHNISFAGYTRNALNQSLRTMVAENRRVDEIIQSVVNTRGRTAQNGAANGIYLQEALVSEFRLDYLDDQTGFFTETVLGVKTTCISCHDGAYHLEEVNKGLSTMTRDQFWGMAAFLAKSHFLYEIGGGDDLEFGEQLKRTTMIDFDVEGFNRNTDFLIFADDDRDRTGEYDARSGQGEGMRPARNGGLVTPRYFTTGEAPAANEPRRAAFARILTADRQFARNIVNRVWAHFTGEGFVHPVDDWDLGRINETVAAQYNTTVQPKTPKLMEWLTQSFIDSDYDLKALLRTIANGPAVYDRAPKVAGTWPDVDTWRKNRKPRRLAAEAVVDAFFKIHRITPRLTVTSMLDRTFTNPWEMPGPNEPSVFAIYTEDFEAPPKDPRELGYRNLNEYYFFQDFTQSTMQAFNRGQYELGIKRSAESSIQNSLTLLNDEAWNFYLTGESASPLVASLVNAINEQVALETVVTVMFHEVLFRDPNAAELEHVLGYFQEKTPEVAVSDLLWSLFNHPDFLYK